MDLDTVFGDGTHRKANANSRKHENKVVEIVKKHYDGELLEEINKDREEHGKKVLNAKLNKKKNKENSQNKRKSLIKVNE